MDFLTSFHVLQDVVMHSFSSARTRLRPSRSRCSAIQHDSPAGAGRPAPRRGGGAPLRLGHHLMLTMTPKIKVVVDKRRSDMAMLQGDNFDQANTLTLNLAACNPPIFEPSWTSRLIQTSRLGNRCARSFLPDPTRTLVVFLVV